MSTIIIIILKCTISAKQHTNYQKKGTDKITKTSQTQTLTKIACKLSLQLFIIIIIINIIVSKCLISNENNTRKLTTFKTKQNKPKTKQNEHLYLVIKYYNYY